MAGPRSLVTGRRVKGSTGRRNVEPWPRFEPEEKSAAVLAERAKFARIAAARLELRFGPGSDIAQMLGLDEARTLEVAA